MKKLIIAISFLTIGLTGYGQIWLTDALDSTKVRYATFETASTSGMSAEVFFQQYLGLENPNKLVPSDTLYSPDSTFLHIKYRQYYDNYYVENSRLTLTFHDNNIIRFKGNYLQIESFEKEKYKVEDAVDRYNHYYGINTDSCTYCAELLITEDTSQNSNAVLCFKIRSNNKLLTNKTLYVSATDLSIVKEEYAPGSGFNATLHTRFNGIRQANQCGYDSLFWLSDFNAAIHLLKIDSGVTTLGTGVPNSFFNKTNVWGEYPDSIYPQHILDAYWAACQYSFYMQNTFNCPKDYFQRHWYNGQQQYIVEDTMTRVYVALNTFVDNTHWTSIEYDPQNKESGKKILRNIIIIGAPGPNHYPKASIDEVVHEYAHIFSHQSWEPKYLINNRIDDEICEACADIWAAIITNSIYHDETKTWKIGEDVVLPSSGHSCIRNLSNPSDPNAEIQMDENRCQEPGFSTYERSGVFSHWFYLLTHGYSGEGCTGVCYNFEGIPIDSAAKLMYYLETIEIVNGMDSYEQLALYTLDATENFSNPDIIKTSVLGAWNVLGVKPTENGLSQFGLSYSTLNNGTYTVDKDLIIDSARTLTIQGTVYLSDTCSIIIQPGSKLVIDGGTLTSACPNEMWQGIEVVGDRTKQQLTQYQGKVELKNGATIENALCGIRTGLSTDANFTTTGGIISASEAVFRNNRRAVEINPYSYTALSGTIATYNASFVRCTFTVNSDNVFSYNNTSFAEHVKLNGVKDITFKGCTFNNLINSVLPNNRGIYAENAGLILDVKCDDNYIFNPNDCGCPPSLSDTCSFYGFNTAVEVNTTGDPYSVTVDRAVFTNNAIGIKVNSIDYITVTRCNFNLQNAPYVIQNTGLYLNVCDGYKVEGNRFHKSGINQNLTSTGIHVIGNGANDNSIYRNTFDTLDYGIRVTGNNGNTDGGLQITAGNHRRNIYGIYIDQGATVSPWQGVPSKGADNLFANMLQYSIYNAGSQLITYHYSFNYFPGNVTTTNVSLVGRAVVNPRTSTLCGGGFIPLTFAGFQSDMDAYTTLLVDDEASDMTDGGTVGANNYLSPHEMRQSISDTYYTAVRTLMSDSLLDLAALEQWHTAAQPIADPYSLTETRFVEGYADPFVADADDLEMANYAEFHAMKLALRDNGAGNDGTMETQNFASLQPGGYVNWYALTPAQIAQLQTIAERNTGRASVMAKGVLCFFFGICYEDGGNATSETDPSAETRAKHTAADIADETALTVYPNPTNDLLFVELRGAGIANVALYDLQGRVVETRHGTSLQDGTATLNVKSLPAGVYVLRVKDANGNEHQQKIVRR